MPADHHLASASTVSIKDLSQEPLVLFSRTLAPESSQQIEQLFLHAGAGKHVVHELENLLSMISFVVMGSGAASFLITRAAPTAMAGNAVIADSAPL